MWHVFFGVLILATATSAGVRAPSTSVQDWPNRETQSSFRLTSKSIDSSTASNKSSLVRVSLDSSNVGVRSPQTNSTASNYLDHLSSFNWQGPMDMCVLNGYLYAAANLGMLVWDVRNPANPIFVRQYDWPTSIRSTFVLKGQGNFLYLLSSNEGISIIDASDPYNLIVRSKMPLPVQQDYMEVGGHFLYIPSLFDYFFVIDVADPDHPSIVTQYSVIGIDFGWLHGMTIRQTDSMPQSIVTCAPIHWAVAAGSIGLPLQLSI